MFKIIMQHANNQVIYETESEVESSEITSSEEGDETEQESEEEQDVMYFQEKNNTAQKLDRHQETANKYRNNSNNNIKKQMPEQKFQNNAVISFPRNQFGNRISSFQGNQNNNNNYSRNSQEIFTGRSKFFGGQEQDQEQKGGSNLNFIQNRYTFQQQFKQDICGDDQLNVQDLRNFPSSQNLTVNSPQNVNQKQKVGEIQDNIFFGQNQPSQFNEFADHQNFTQNYQFQQQQQQSRYQNGDSIQYNQSIVSNNNNNNVLVIRPLVDANKITRPMVSFNKNNVTRPMVSFVRPVPIQCVIAIPNQIVVKQPQLFHHQNQPFNCNSIRGPNIINNISSEQQIILPVICQQDFQGSQNNQIQHNYQQQQLQFQCSYQQDIQVTTNQRQSLYVNQQEEQQNQLLEFQQNQIQDSQIVPNQRQNLQINQQKQQNQFNQQIWSNQTQDSRIVSNQRQNLDVSQQTAGNRGRGRDRGRSRGNSGGQGCRFNQSFNQNVTGVKSPSREIKEQISCIKSPPREVLNFDGKIWEGQKIDDFKWTGNKRNKKQKISNKTVINSPSQNLVQNNQQILQHEQQQQQSRLNNYNSCLNNKSKNIPQNTRQISVIKSLSSEVPQNQPSYQNQFNSSHQGTQFQLNNNNPYTKNNLQHGFVQSPQIHHSQSGFQQQVRNYNNGINFQNSQQVNMEHTQQPFQGQFIPQNTNIRQQEIHNGNIINYDQNNNVNCNQQEMICPPLSNQAMSFSHNFQNQSTQLPFFTEGKSLPPQSVCFQNNRNKSNLGPHGNKQIQNLENNYNSINNIKQKSQLKRFVPEYPSNIHSNSSTLADTCENQRQKMLQYLQS